MTERFRSIDQVRAEQARLRTLREAHEKALSGHWDALGDGEVQKGLAGSMVKCILRSVLTWRNARAAAGMAAPSLLGALTGAAVSGGTGGPWRRTLGAVLGAAVPLFWERYVQGGRLQHLFAELGRSWEHVKDHVRDRYTSTHDDGSATP